MRTRAMHLLVRWNSIYSAKWGDHEYVLCRTPLKENNYTEDRERVTCKICLHHMREFGDKHVIERGNVFTPGRQLAELRSFIHGEMKQFIGRRYDERTREDAYEACAAFFRQYGNLTVELRRGPRTLRFSV